ncbi:hypothetical protein J4216_05650 [Candidatus Woesearchaeota archaeon]|nr:hypothetical protein [Candidatus Woesearchaeota archaeon]
MGIKEVRSYFSSHTGDEKKLLKLLKFSFLSLDKLKKNGYIGECKESIDYNQIIKNSKFPEKSLPEKYVVKEILKNYQNVINVAHPLTQVNVNPPPTNLSIVMSSITAKYNENGVWDFLGHSAAISEMLTISMLADLIGYNKSNTGGIFTFGGTASNLYAGRIGISKILKNSRDSGLRNEKVVFICSELAHYSTVTAAIWLGVGKNNIITIPSNEKNEMDLKYLENTLKKLKKEKVSIACIYATIGTTDAFGIDPLFKINQLCKKLKINTHIHADAVIGWVYLTFKGYNFDLIKDKKIASEIKYTYNQVEQIKYADSVGIDFHKTGWTNYLSSCFILKNKEDFKLIERNKESTPYLFHGSGYKPGEYTLETSRPNYAQKTLANILGLGKEGYRELVIHLFTIRQYFEELCEKEGILVLNKKNNFFVTDLRLYPNKVEKDYFKKELEEQLPLKKIEEINEYNKKIVEIMEKNSKKEESTLFSLSKKYKSTKKGHPIYCIKSFPMSPFIEKYHMDKALKDLLRAKKEVTPI